MCIQVDVICMNSYLHIIQITYMYALIGIVPIINGIALDRATFDSFS